MLKRLFFLICCIGIVTGSIEACTSAIIGATANPYGRPLLWKHRDTSAFDNKIEYVSGKGNDYSYVALFNASDTLLNEAWMGMNEYGFAVMNTASYNLKDDDVAESEMDKEGLIMTKALKICKSIDDFANLLDSLPKPLGVEANFGVIDAFGNGGYFETDNYSYKVYRIEDTEDHVLVRTNYSHSGRPEEGFGFIREGNANHLLESYKKQKNITPEVLTEELSRSFYHDLIGKDLLAEDEEWIVDQDFIPRYTSTATIVIEGCIPKQTTEQLNPEEITEEYILWSGLGYPPCAEIIPVWCKEDGVDPSLRGSQETGRSLQCDLVLERKKEVFPFKKGNGNKYIDKQKLINKEGTGYIQVLVPKNLETYRTTREKTRRRKLIDLH